MADGRTDGRTQIGRQGPAWASTRKRLLYLTARSQEGMSDDIAKPEPDVLPEDDPFVKMVRKQLAADDKAVIKAKKHIFTRRANILRKETNRYRSEADKYT